MEKRLPGVYPSTRKDNSIYYRSSLTYRRKHISLGSFDSMIKAHAAYLEGYSVLNDSDYTIADYSAHRILSLEKWVTLLNFRDNKIYFATPIYLHTNFFEYYLSSALILKFDIDDLFYYSSHKIMRRGNHYFVADYGMQVNIVNRYGIKNYAVMGRDYQFVNGDTTDYRYENIEIYNTYHGVECIQQKGRICYRTRLHINGNHTVGIYQTATEAAVAYNKAIDYAKKAGISKDFAPNYMDELSPSAYADLYATLPISLRNLQS